MTTAVLPFLASLLAAGNVVIALGVWSLPVTTIALAAATLLARDARDLERPGLREAAFSRMVTLWVVYSIVLILTIVLFATRGAREIPLAASVLLALQVLTLAMRGLAHATLPVFVNAQALGCVAALAGGLPAALGMTGSAVFTVLWLGLRHLEARRVPLNAALAATVPWAAATGGFLAAGFALAPAPRIATIGPGGVTGETVRLAGAYLELATWMGLGLLTLLALRWLSGRGQERDESTAPAPEPEPMELLSLDALSPASRPFAIDPRSTRGQLIACYLGFLDAAAELGHTRPASTTPHEFATSLPEPARRLATAFGRARYGAEPIVEADVAAARDAAETTLDRLRAGSAATGG